MKRILLCGLVLSAIFFASSCKKESSLPIVQEETGFKKLGIDPKMIGIEHNKVMSYLNTNWTKFNPGTALSMAPQFAAVEEVSQQESDMLYAYATEYMSVDFPDYQTSRNQLYDVAYSTNIDYYYEYKSTYPSAEVDAYELAPTIYAAEHASADSLLNVLQNGNLVSDRERTFISNALMQFEQIEQSRSYSEYPSTISQLQNQYLAQGFNESNGEGFLASVLLEVAGNSYNYWTNVYPSEITVGTIQGPTKVQVLPVWAGADAVGALAGAGGSLWSQRNNAKIDWWEVGGQAVIWGAAGSIPATRWFSKIFK